MNIISVLIVARGLLLKVLKWMKNQRKWKSKTLPSFMACHSKISSKILEQALLSQYDFWTLLPNTSNHGSKMLSKSCFIATSNDLKIRCMIISKSVIFSMFENFPTKETAVSLFEENNSITFELANLIFNSTTQLFLNSTRQRCLKSGRKCKTVISPQWPPVNSREMLFLIFVKWTGATRPN